MPSVVKDIQNEAGRAFGPSANPFGRYHAKGYDPNEASFNDPYHGMSGARQEEYGRDQQALIAALQARAAGEGQSIAQRAFGQATDRNLAQMAGLVGAGSRGVSPALAMRQLTNANAGIAQQAAGQAGNLRLQEMNDASGQLATALAGFRGQDIGMWRGGREDLMGLEGLKAQNAWNTQATNAGADAAARGRGAQLAGGILNGGGAAGAAVLKALVPSDERLKTDVHDGKEDVRALLDAIRSRSFQYKDPSGTPGATPGPQVGVMAQDLERGGPIGRGMVLDTPNGKMVDSGRAATAALAAASDLDERLDKVEGGDGEYGALLARRKKLKEAPRATTSRDLSTGRAFSPAPTPGGGAMRGLSGAVTGGESGLGMRVMEWLMSREEKLPREVKKTRETVVRSGVNG